MSKGLFLPGDSSQSVDVFVGNSPLNQRNYHVWHKPRGKTMLFIEAYGAGGNGGLGVVGANSAAAGGGGGGSGGKTTVLIPLAVLPDVLYICVPDRGVAMSAFVSVATGTPAALPATNYVLANVNAGGVGGNAAGATAGSAGTAAAAVGLGNCPIAGKGFFLALAGQAGVIGGVAVAAAALSLPTTGLNVTGGTGGGGLPAAATNGTAGGNITGAAQAGTPYELRTLSGGSAVTAATTPADNGRPGMMIGDKFYFFGGTGGSSTHGSATTTGLVQSNGGDGASGCGGGGSGGALTGSTAGKAGLGGAGMVIMVTW